MRIGVPIASFHPGTTGEYVWRALTDLGYESSILSPHGFGEALKNDSFDLYLCVDSGEPLDLSPYGDQLARFGKLGFWFIDFRHNKDRPTRRPTDWETAALVDAYGGWIFQAQHEDAEECRARGFSRTAWIPMAADPQVWSDTPPEPSKRFDLAFAGNVWDAGRAQALERIAQSGLRLGFGGHGKIWKEQAARLLRASRAGFNISSWFGAPYAFDLNMRFFETLATGTPLVTNSVESIARISKGPLPFVRTYSGLEDLTDVCFRALADDGFLQSGPHARAWVIEGHTYRHRVLEMLSRLADIPRPIDPES